MFYIKNYFHKIKHDYDTVTNRATGVQRTGGVVRTRCSVQRQLQRGISTDRHCCVTTPPKEAPQISHYEVVCEI